MPQIGQNSYSQSGGIFPLPEPIQEPRNPSSLDNQYSLYQRWINTETFEIFSLMNFDSSSGTVLADWRSESSLGQTFTGDIGGPVSPDAGGNLNILGESGHIVVTGTPATNTLTISLAGGGTAIDSINVDTNTPPGTDPVLPDATGQITITGAQVSPGTIGANVIRTDSLAANTFSIEVQQTSAVAAKDTTKNGVCHFNNSQFSNDEGFISFTGTLTSWQVIGASQNLAVDTGYICGSGAALSLALPTTSIVGDIIEVALDGSTSWTITQGAGQQIRIGNSTTTLGAGGSVASTAQGDAIRMVCRTANTLWIAVGGTIGALSVT